MWQIFISCPRLLIHNILLRMLGLVFLGGILRLAWVTIGLLGPKVCDIDEIEVVLEALELVSYTQAKERISVYD